MQGLHYAQVNGNLMSYTLPILKLLLWRKVEISQIQKLLSLSPLLGKQAGKISRVTVGHIEIDHCVDFGSAIQLEPQFESVPFT